jgi:hypothetical protein
MVVKAFLLPQKPISERIEKLEAEVEALFDLTIRAYVRFIFSASEVGGSTDARSDRQRRESDRLSTAARLVVLGSRSRAE